MYDPNCLTTTKKAWLAIEETLLNNPDREEAVDCLKRVRHLLVHCIRQEEAPPSAPRGTSAQEP